MVDNVHVVYYGYDLEFKGLKLDTLDKVDLMNDPNYEFLPGHRYIVVYNDTAKYDYQQPHLIIQSKGIHFGPRGENFYDFTKCPYLTTRDGIYFKFIYKKYEWVNKFISEKEYTSMLPYLDQIQLKLRNADLQEGVSKRTGKPYYKLVYERLKDTSDDINDFIDREDYIKIPEELEFIKRIRSREDIINSFEYFLSQPIESIFGFDYETHGGFPFEDPTFEPVGLGIACCNTKVAAYYDIQWMMYWGKDGEFELFKIYLGKYLDKFENSVAYNVSFEMRVTYLLLRRICLFDEGATINKCEGRVYKRLSLKFTAQCVNGNWSWDDDFERLTGELLPELFGWNEETEEYKWKLVPDGTNIIQGIDPTKTVWDEEVGDFVPDLNPTDIEVPNYYKNNPVWDEILALWPEEQSEFELLIEKFYGDPFACIPSNIQTQYCCRDAFNTGMLKVNCLKKFTPLCYSTYDNNLKLEALLHMTGFFCDEDLRLLMVKQCYWMVVYGRLNVTRWMLSEKMKWFKDINIPEVPQISNLLKAGYDPCVSKPILMNHLSDDTQSGLDEEALLKLVGPEVLDIYKKYVKEFCYRIDSSYSRSRKIFNELDAYLKEIYNPIYGPHDSYLQWTVDGVDYRINMSYSMLMDYYNTKTQYESIVNFCNQLNYKEIEKLMLSHLGEYHLPDHLIDVDGTEFTLDDVIEYCKTCFNYASDKESPYFYFSVYNKFKGTLYHAYITGYDSLDLNSHTVIDQEDYTASRNDGYTPILIEERCDQLLQEDLERLKFTDSYRYYELNHDKISLLYKGIMEETYHNEETGKDEALFQNKPTGKFDKDHNPIYTWSDDMEQWFTDTSNELKSWFDFLVRYVGYWSLSKDDAKIFQQSIDDVDIEGDTLASLAKLNYCYTSAKKYDKVLGTSVQGKHFYEFNYDCDYFDENGVTADKYTPHGVHKCYLPFNANEKKSKRWASPWHTIPSKSEMKTIVTTPPGYLMSYFDISGAEIRTISFLSKDPFMMQCYHDGKDPYITLASFTWPEETYNPDDHDGMEYKDYLKSWRGCFKQVLLGSLYGMGEDKMAEVAEIDVELARKVLKDLWERCPVLKEFIEKKSQWAEDHPGYIESALGDVVELGDEDGEDRFARLGINQFIQNYSSVSLADGFFNNIEKSIHYRDEVLHDKDFILRPAGVVHDSCQIYFPTKYLFEMQEYYTRNLTGYLFDIHQILYAFDLEIGANYYDMLDMKQSDPTHMEFSGNWTSIMSFLKKCTADNLGFKVISCKTNPKHGDAEDIEVIDNTHFGELFKPKYYNSVIDQFFDNNCFACFHRDKSKFKIKIEKF